MNHISGSIIPGLLTYSKSLISVLRWMCGPSENSEEGFPCRKLRTPIRGEGGGGTFNIDLYGIWVNKALNGDRELFLVFGSAYLGRERAILGRETPPKSRMPHGW